MTKVNQKTATVNAILSVLSARDVEYEMGGETKMSEVITPEDKTAVRAILFTAFRAGEVEHKSSFQESVDDDAKLKSYISGLLNNWVRKNKEFNGGVIYKAKNPGSRAGQKDPAIKEMRKLLSVTADVEAKAVIQATIDAKLSEIKAVKENVTIDASLLPESLRGLVQTEEA